MSPCTSANAAAASRQTRAAGSSCPDGPAAVSRSRSRSGIGIGLRIQAGQRLSCGAMTAFPDSRRLVGLARERGGSLRAELDAHDSPNRSTRRPATGLFSCLDERPQPPSIDTDLLTPLGAYLRLRAHGPRELPARVGRAGPARPLLARRLRRRGSSPFEEAERCDEPVVGYLGYDYVAKLEPTVPLPERRARRCPRAGSSSPTRSCASTTCAASPRCSRGDPDEIDRAARGEPSPAPPPRVRARAAATPRFPIAGRLRARRRGAARSTSARGDAFQIVLSQRAERPTAASALALYRVAAPRQPVAVPLPARARRHRARRLLAGDAREAARARARRVNPIAGSTAARRRRCRAAARLARRTAPST